MSQVKCELFVCRGYNKIQGLTGEKGRLQKNMEQEQLHWITNVNQKRGALWDYHRFMSKQLMALKRNRMTQPPNLHQNNVFFSENIEEVQQ